MRYKCDSECDTFSIDSFRLLSVRASAKILCMENVFGQPRTSRCIEFIALSLKLILSINTCLLKSPVIECYERRVNRTKTFRQPNKIMA